MTPTRIIAGPSPPNQTSWLNRNVVGMGLTSLLSDVSHEMATAILPGFLAALGASPAALGFIEGAADGVASFVKLGAGWLSDRLDRRKPLVVSGYFVTGVSQGIFALALGWPLILMGRVVGWFGRGMRGPARNAILAGSVPPQARGKAFGFHRASDTLGAIMGPLVAVALLAHFHGTTSNPTGPFRIVFTLTLLPGLAAGIAFAALVSESPRAAAPVKFRAALGSLPARFRRFLWGVGVFGLGDFAHTLMILAAIQLLTPSYGVAHAAEIAGLLYVAHNIFYASASYPVGALSDRVGRRGLLALGYFLGAATAAGFLIAFEWKVASISFLLLLFAMGGIYVAAEEAIEGVLTADLADPATRGTAFGVLGSVNGVGDFTASALVGALWTSLSPVVAFGYAALLMGSGAVVILAQGRKA